MIVLFVSLVPQRIAQCVKRDDDLTGVQTSTFQWFKYRGLSATGLGYFTGKTVATKRLFDKEQERGKAMVASLSPFFSHSSARHKFTPRNTNLKIVDASAYHYELGNSMAEKIITSHQPRDNTKPLVLKNGVQYPKNPENSYVSR